MNPNEEQNRISPESLPLYKKGMEIETLVRQIGDLIDEKNKMLLEIKHQMQADALTLVVKVAGADAVELYDKNMENATIIRKAANDLKVQVHGLRMFGFEYPEYFEMVRNLIEEYRLLFIHWVQGFDKWNYIIDRWGLFNPPGVGPFDHDPDDDIPSTGDED